jgi:hypothetical protein
MEKVVFVILFLIFKDLEWEPPLFNPQNEGTAPGYAYYLCYHYPRPSYWISRCLRWFHEDSVGRGS